jgi:hypothetical protein
LITTAELLAGATDSDGDPLSIANLSSNAGTLVDNGDGTWALTPSANFNGAVSLSYTISDGQGGTTTASAMVNFTSVNDGPTAVAHTASSDEDANITFTTAQLLANATDTDGDALEVISVGNASHGAVILENGVVTFTPFANFNGEASFDYTISDGHGGVATARTQISVAAVNDGPVANRLIKVQGSSRGSAPVASAGPRYRCRSGLARSRATMKQKET